MKDSTKSTIVNDIKQLNSYTLESMLDVFNTTERKLTKDELAFYAELYKELESRKEQPKLEKGGNIAEQNKDMLNNQAREVDHHIDELNNVLKSKVDVEPWVVAKMERATTDLSDITHYLDGEQNKEYSKSVYATGGVVGKDITFNKWDETRQGTILELTDDGDYVVSSGFGNTLVSPDDVISFNEPKAKAKRFGFFKNGGSTSGLKVVLQDQFCLNGDTITGEYYIKSERKNSNGITIYTVVDKEDGKIYNCEIPTSIIMDAKSKYSEGGGVGESGLQVIGMTKEDNTKIGKMIEEQGLHAEFNAREGYWFFPEEEDLYDSLESELENQFEDYNIDARFEGIFKNGGGVDDDFVIFSIDDDALDTLLNDNHRSELDYEDIHGDSYYKLNRRDFDRFIDYADSIGFDVDYENNEDAVVYVVNERMATGGMIGQKVKHVFLEDIHGKIVAGPSTFMDLKNKGYDKDIELETMEDDDPYKIDAENNKKSFYAVDLEGYHDGIIIMNEGDFKNASNKMSEGGGVGDEKGMKMLNAYQKTEKVTNAYEKFKEYMFVLNKGKSKYSRIMPYLNKNGVVIRYKDEDGNNIALITYMPVLELFTRKGSVSSTVKNLLPKEVKSDLNSHTTNYFFDSNYLELADDIKILNSEGELIKEFKNNSSSNKMSEGGGVGETNETYIIQGVPLKKGDKFKISEDSSIYTFHGLEKNKRYGFDEILASSDWDDNIKPIWRIDTMESNKLFIKKFSNGGGVGEIEPMGWKHKDAVEYGKKIVDKGVKHIELRNKLEEHYPGLKSEMQNVINDILDYKDSKMTGWKHKAKK